MTYQSGIKAQRAATLVDQAGFRIVLSHYGPAHRMLAHAHDFHQVSFLLVGEFVECGAGDRREITGPSYGYKAAGFDHANEYGRNGALILSVNFASDSELTSHICTDAWR